MDIEFDNPKHEALINDYEALCKKYNKKGFQPAIEILVTIDSLKAAPNLAQLPPTFRPHPLQGVYKGYFAVDVTKKERVIFKPDHNGDPSFRIDTPSTISSIIVIEIFTDYH